MAFRTAILFVLLLTATFALSQGVCPATTKSNKLICTIPQIYGPAGLTLPNPFHAAHFDSDFEASFTPLTTAIGTQLTSLPIASPASGFTFSLDRALGVFTRSTESFGPVLAERAETIGRHKLYLGFTFQHFGFSSIDGIDLKHVPSVYTHIDINPDGTNIGPGQPASPGTPAFERDYIVTDNRVDLKVNQYTAFATFGLTNRMDVSVAIPFLSVGYNASAAATIVRNSAPSPVFGFSHYFDAACINNIPCQAASTQATFFNPSSASGIGDVVFRYKATVWRGEKTRLAVGTDFRVPTGDELNFLGSGAYGFKPFVAVSMASRISPHANLGVLVNTNSVLSGDIATGTTGRLPTQFLYSGGVDVRAAKSLTLSADLIGSRVFNADRAGTAPYVDITGQTVSNVTQLAITKGSYSIDDFAVGAKFSPVNKLLIIGNVLIKLDDGGLRAKAIPLIGISYAF
jgi:Putative MetA-pathway of phenol degradation